MPYKKSDQNISIAPSKKQEKELVIKDNQFTILLPSVEMASLQCNRPTHETCQQKCHGNSSLGQKMSGMASWVKGGNSTCKPLPTYQTQTYQTHHVATSKIQTQCYSSQAQAHHGQGLAKPHKAQCANKTSGGHNTHAYGHSNHSHTKHHATSGVACQCVNKSNCLHSKSVSHSHSHSQGHSHSHSSRHATSQTAATLQQKKEPNLFRRIKNRISGNSSCSDSSDSDNECCRQRKK